MKKLKKCEEGGQIRPGYEKWKASLPKNLQSEVDYDLQAYYNKYGSKGLSSNGHLTDEFKKPNHPTFSNESIYYNSSTWNKAGFWTPEDVYIPFNNNRPAIDERNNKIIPFTSYQKAGGKYELGGEDPIKGFTKLNSTKSKITVKEVVNNIKKYKDEAELNRRKDKINLSHELNKKKGEFSKEALANSSIGEKFRFFPNDPNSIIDEYLNPLKMVGDMADNIGKAFFDDNSSIGDKALSVVTPLGVGALAGIGAKTTGQFVNNLANPLAGIKNPFKSNTLSISDGIKKLAESPKQYDEYLKAINNQKAYIQSDAYLTNRATNTGETVEVIKKDVAKILKRFDKTDLYIKPNPTNGANSGSYAANNSIYDNKPQIEVDATTPYDKFGTFDHEIKHALSPVSTGKFNAYKNFPTLQIDKPIKGSKSFSKYLSLPYEQQVRFDKIKDYMVENHGIPKGTHYNDDQMDLVRMGINNGDLFKGSYSDVGDLLKQVSQDQKGFDSLGDALKNSLNKSWAIAPLVGAGVGTKYMNSQGKSGYKNGGATSIEGYKRNSPDRNNSYNVIPSNQITMQDVDYPVYGIDDLGNQQLMYPGQEYNYPGNYITEYPMKNKRLKKAQFGGQDEDPYNFGPQSTPFYDYGRDTQFMEGNVKDKPIPNKPTIKIKDYLSATKKAMPRMTSNLMNDFVDPSSLYNVLGYAEAGINAFNNNKSNNTQEEWLRTQRNTDNLFPVNPGDDRGNYITNGSAYGQFRPDQLYAYGGMVDPETPEQKAIRLALQKKQGNNYISTQANVDAYATSGLNFTNPQELDAWYNSWAQPTAEYLPNKGIGYGAYTQSPGSTYKRNQWTPAEKEYVMKSTGMKEKDIMENLPLVEKYLNQYRMKPKQEYGGQTAGYALDLNGKPLSKDTTKKGKISKTLQPVDEDEANIEAELGETIFGDFDQDGINEHMDIGGKKHSQGGTPLNAPPASFIFSDSKDIKIKGKILESFGKKEDTKKKYTPAELAKQYDINKYKAILDDKNADPVKIRTAEMMIQNYNDKLGKLALVQEDKKGFPNGVPQVAIPYLMGQIGQEGIPSMSTNQTEFADGGQYDPWDEYTNWTDPYKGGLTKRGATTPTGKNNKYNREDEYLDLWEQVIPGIKSMDNSKAQALMYQYTLKNNPQDVKDMWSTYGLTAKGLKDKNLTGLTKNGVFNPENLTSENLNKLESAYSDGYFGVRQLDPRTNPRTLAPLSGPQVKIGSTSNTPSIVKPVSQIPTSTDPNEMLATTSGTQAPTDFWTQDKINTGYALNNRANLKKYLPWAAPIDAELMDPTFYDPTRELASNSEAMNTEMMYNNQFSGAQGASVRNSAVAGAGASNVANIMGRYSNQNVGVANQFEQVNNQITNTVAAAQGDRANKLYDGTTIANQQFDNSRSQANDVIRKNILSGLDNKQKAQWINSWYPQFDIDPSNGYVNFAKGTGYKGVTPGGSAPQSLIEVYKALKAKHPDVPDDILKDQAKQLTAQAKNTVTSDGDVRSTTQGQMPAALQALLQSFGR